MYNWEMFGGTKRKIGEGKKRPTYEAGGTREKCEVSGGGDKGSSSRRTMEKVKRRAPRSTGDSRA